jgi:hypothetical protein
MANCLLFLVFPPRDQKSRLRRNLLLRIMMLSGVYRPVRGMFSEVEFVKGNVCASLQHLYKMYYAHFFTVPHGVVRGTVSLWCPLLPHMKIPNVADVYGKRSMRYVRSCL